MKKAMDDVIEFHFEGGLLVNGRPTVLVGKDKALRRDLIEEEAVELLDAIDENNIVKIADGIADLIYVAVGTAISYGIDLPAVWDEVHAANMRKFAGGMANIREDGKIIKPPCWTPPDVAGVLSRQDNILNKWGK